MPLGAAAGGLLASAFLPVAIAFADTSDPFTTFAGQVDSTASATELANLDSTLNTGDPTLAASLGSDVTTGSTPFGIGQAPAADDAFANLLPADATTAQINEAANFDAVLYNGDPTLAASLAASDSTGVFPDAPGSDAFTIGTTTFDPYTVAADGTATEGFAPVTAGTGTSPFFETGTVDSQNFDIFGTASGSTTPTLEGTIDTSENVTSLGSITNTGFDVTSAASATGGSTAGLPADGTIYDITNFGSGYENVYTDVPGAAAGDAGTATDTFVTPFGDYDLSSLVSAFDLSSLDPGAAFGIAADTGSAAADAVGSVDPLSFLGL